MSGTFIRVGSSNRLADETIIAELERKKINVSFDSELNMVKPAGLLKIDNFNSFFHEKTGEEPDDQILKKLALTKDYNGII